MSEPARDAQPTVLLFDIDGTLLKTGGAGRRSMRRAFVEVCGREDALDGMDFRGMTDPLIFEGGLARIGVPVSERFHKKGAQIMAKQQEGISWLQNKADIIMLSNRSGHNFILELPTGRYRLDAGRRMRTMRSILAIPQVKQLVDQGELVVE